MSVDRHDYIIIGYKMPYNILTKYNHELADMVREDDNMYLPYYEGWKGESYRIIIDGMSGNYIVFGKVIAESGEYDGFDFPSVKLNYSDYSEVISKAKEVFIDIDSFDFSNPEILIFSHFS